MDTLHEEIEHLVGHLVKNNVDTLHEEKNHLMGFSFIRVYGSMNGDTHDANLELFFSY